MTNEQTIDAIMDAVRDYGTESALGDRSGQEPGAQFVADMIAAALAAKDAEIAELKQRLADSGRDLQALKADPALGEWVEWKGGECPIAYGTWCGTRLRDGSEDFRLAEEWVWMHDECEWDIVSYRIIP